MYERRRIKWIFDRCLRFVDEQDKHRCRLFSPYGPVSPSRANENVADTKTTKPEGLAHLHLVFQRSVEPDEEPIRVPVNVPVVAQKFA